MSSPLPRIETVTVVGCTTLGVKWRDGSSDRIDLAGWIATGSEILRPLADPDTFRTAQVGGYGGMIYWGDEDGDLAIDALHLQLLAEEQRPFRREDLIRWQAEMGLSNQEAASFLSIGLSTWNGYKAGAPIPVAIAMLCRAARRDPVLMQAHYRPRKSGRPRADEVFEPQP